MDEYKLNPSLPDHWDQKKEKDDYKTISSLFQVKFSDRALFAAQSILRRIESTLVDSLNWWAPSEFCVKQTKEICFFWREFPGGVSLSVSPCVVSLRFKKKKVKALGIDLTVFDKKKIKKKGKYTIIENSIHDYTSIRSFLPKLLEKGIVSQN